MKKPFLLGGLLAGLVNSSLHTALAADSEITGQLALQGRLFTHDALLPRQHDGLDLSLAGELEYYREWRDGDDSLTVKPFFRGDNQDRERSHADIRELYWQHVADDWELRIGLNKVFWGVTESVHLVDIINQTDLVEDTDGEDKLGQPMINLSWIAEQGVLDLFLLPGFRDRTFPGITGRLRTEPYVDTDQTQYQARNGRGHFDWAVRWSQVIGDWDLGLAHFQGTSRDPSLLPGGDGAGTPVLIPYYPLIRQTSLDAQLTTNDWLWKLEWLSRAGQGSRYTAAAGGFEYTRVGILDTAADLGLIGEYLFDDRGASAPTLFQNDLMLGARLTLNDVQSSELLFGVVQDLDSPQRLYSLEASRRLGDDWTLSLESRFNSHLNAADLFGAIRRDDFIQLELTRYF